MLGELFERIKVVVEKHGDIALQGRKAKDAVGEVDMYSFSYREVDVWISARCFSAQAAYDLARGVHPRANLHSHRCRAGRAIIRTPIGFKVSKGDLSISGALGAGI
jgi:hypothetical protein